uniref:Uncharacterized protein n=1 Tax=Timema genevievae TaxID=629358 RepID=A0A7R9PRE4_TIMGE|nr:unnamed protein product [Timema genevievae]
MSGDGRSSQQALPDESIVTGVKGRETQLHKDKLASMVKSQDMKALVSSGFFQRMKGFLKPTGYKPMLVLSGLFFFQQFSGIYSTLFYAVTFFEVVPKYAMPDNLVTTGTSLPGPSQGRYIDKRRKRPIYPRKSDKWYSKIGRLSRKLRVGTILILTATDVKSANIVAITEMPLSNTACIPVKVEPHRFLNVCKGVVTCFDLDCELSLRNPPPPSTPWGTPPSPPRGPKLRAAIVETINPASGTPEVWMSGRTGEAAKVILTGALRKNQRGTAEKITLNKASKDLTKPLRKNPPTLSLQDKSKPLLKREVQERLGKA